MLLQGTVLMYFRIRRLRLHRPMAVQLVDQTLSPGSTVFKLQPQTAHTFHHTPPLLKPEHVCKAG